MLFYYQNAQIPSFSLTPLSVKTPWKYAKNEFFGQKWRYKSILMPIYTDRKLLIYYPTSAYIRPHGCLCPIVNTVFYGKITFVNYKIRNFGSQETFFTIKTLWFFNRNWIVKMESIFINSFHCGFIYPDRIWFVFAKYKSNG